MGDDLWRIFVTIWFAVTLLDLLLTIAGVRHE